MTSFVLLFVLVGVGLRQTDCIRFKNSDYRLYEYLFTDYNPWIRPRNDSTKPIQVNVSFSLMQINSVNDKEQVLTTTGYLSVEWVDDLLQWNASDFNGIKKMVLMPDAVWLPDIGVDNTATSIYDPNHRKEYRVLVESTGKVTWVPGGQFVTSCGLDITFYPYDHQICKLRFTNWVYPDLNDYAVSGEWHINTTRAQRGARQYAEAYPFIEFSLYLERKYWYHIINILMPCVLLSGLMLVVFWLPPDSGEKIGLGITVLLSFTVFLLMIAEKLPQTSDSLPIVGFYLMTIIMISSTSICVTVVVLILHHAKPDHSVPDWVRTLVFGYLARIACLDRKRLAVFREHINRLRSNVKSEMRRHDKDGGQYIHMNGSLLIPNLDAFHRLCESPTNNVDSPPLYPQPIESRIMTNLEKIIGESDKTDQESAIGEEWKMVATIVDRFFFSLYMAIVLLLTFVILIATPLFMESKVRTLAHLKTKGDDI